MKDCEGCKWIIKMWKGSKLNELVCLKCFLCGAEFENGI